MYATRILTTSMAMAVSGMPDQELSYSRQRLFPGFDGKSQKWWTKVNVGPRWCFMLRLFLQSYSCLLKFYSRDLVSIGGKMECSDIDLAKRWKWQGERSPIPRNMMLNHWLFVKNDLIACGEPVIFDESKFYGTCRGFKLGTKCDNDIVDVALTPSWHDFTSMRVFCTAIRKRAYRVKFLPSESMPWGLAERRVDGLVAEIERRGTRFKISEWTFTHREESPIVSRYNKRWESRSVPLSVQIQLSETTNNLYVVTCDVSSTELCRLASFESAYHSYQLHHLKLRIKNDRDVHVPPMYAQGHDHQFPVVRHSSSRQDGGVPCKIEASAVNTNPRLNCEMQNRCGFAQAEKSSPKLQNAK